MTLKLESILPHVMGNVGDISIFPSDNLYNYHCLAFNSPLTIK